MDGVTSQHEIANNMFFVVDNIPNVFTQIYNDDTNLVIYKRDVPIEVIQFVKDFLTLKPPYSFTHILKLDQIKQKLIETLPGHDFRDSFINDVHTVCDMFTVLFGLDEIGLRLIVLESAMCPRFHVDNIPCRLLTTYGDTGTEWLSEDNLDRSMLGRGSNGKPDKVSGIYNDAEQINRINSYDIALLKGESWPNNAGKGIVHRSPTVDITNPRLLLSLDFV